jgi:hypothetical protein
VPSDCPGPDGRLAGCGDGPCYGSRHHCELRRYLGGARHTNFLGWRYNDYRRKVSLALNAAQEVRFCLAGDSESTLLNKVEMKLTELDYALDSFINCVEDGIVPETTVEDNFQSFARVCAAETSVRYGNRVLLSQFRE